MRNLAHEPDRRRQTGGRRTARSNESDQQHPILRLQRSTGNQAVLRMLEGSQDPAGPRLQTKLSINEPGDQYEQEAERIADQVMSAAPQPAVTGAPVPLQRVAEETAEAMDAAPSSVETALAAPGNPLEPAIRDDMEQRFGYDFSPVRVHTDAVSEESARDVNALAYTVGHHVVFGASRFSPGTSDGRRLLAHELTHVIQQDRSSTRKVDRFTEPEHKKLGNLATTKFPYFATLASDEVALRSSPHHRRPDDPFHNLVASLRTGVRVVVVGNVGKWLRVIVHSGTALDGKTNKPIDAKGLTGYVSEELLVKEPGVFDQDLPVLPGVTLTYGDFTALGGDHFARFYDLETKAASPGGTDAIKKFVDVVEGRRKGEFEEETTIDKEWADRYKNLAFENISHFSHGGTSVETWKKQHYKALMAAAKAGLYSDVSQLQRAYAMNGFADHYLTDSFSSGHVRTPRIKILEFYQKFFDQHLDSVLSHIYTSIGTRMIFQVFEDHPNMTGIGMVTGNDFCADTRHAATEFKQQAEAELKNNGLGEQDLKKLIVQYIGGAVAKVLHDDDNADGLYVKSKKYPAGWKAFGDGRLDATFQNYAVEAVQASKNEVIQAFNIGTDFKTNKDDKELWEKIKPLVYPASPIEDYIPEEDTARSKALPEWRIDLDISKTMDKAVQDKLTALIKKYLDDKTLDTLTAPIPERIEREVTGPNIFVRPRAATVFVLRWFRDDPVSFLTTAAAGPADLSKAIAESPLCR